MRTHFTQFPTYDELKQILSNEGTHVVPLEKRGEHYTDFSTIIALLRSYNLPIEFFTEQVSFENWKESGFFERTVAMFNDLIEAILSSGGEVDKKLLLDALYDYLSENDELPSSADILFVFGAKSTFRVEKAIDLYKKGFASKIVISGRGPHYEEAAETEAERLAAFAKEQGIPEEALILEKESISVPDNVKRSLTLLENLAIPHTRIALINSPFSQRRGWAHFNKFSDVGTELIRINTDKVSEQFSRDGWYKDGVGVKTIIKEFFGLRVSELINTS
jgi:hypothetical protein